jgi:ArsR family transcriptional regulator, arsenate/arsenite/antimonite-responsive transcriptional repressor
MDSVDMACCPPILDAPLSEHDANDAAALLKALADPVRLRLLSIIASSPDGEVCACDLHGPLGRSQPTVSHHLTQLTRAGILHREQRGKWAWFRIDHQRIAQLSRSLTPGELAGTISAS